MAGEKIINEQVTAAPDFENEVDPTHLLALLDKLMHMLKENPSEETIARIHKTLGYYEIIFAEDKDGVKLWVTSPFIHRRATIRRSFRHRIVNLFDTGEWINEEKYEDSLGIGHPERTLLQLKVEVSVETQKAISNDEALTLFITLKHIYQIIQDSVKRGSGSIGVFKTPYAVINMNTMKEWLGDMEPKNYWSLRYTLATQSLYDMVKEVTFTTESEKEQLKQSS